VEAVISDAAAAAAPALPGFVERLGLALVSPARALVVADGAGGRAGLSDAATLLFLKILCFETRALVAAGWGVVQVGVMPALAGLGPSLQRTIGPDLVLIFVGGIAVTLLAGKRRRPSRDFDLAAVAWVPYLVLQLVVTLTVNVAGLHVGHEASNVLGLAGMAWMAGWLGLAIRVARSRS
jgi:hypothetical protein